MFGTLAMAFTIALAGGTTLYPPVGGYVPVGFGAYYGAFHDVTPIQSLPAIAPVPGVTPGIPASPGAIVTVTQVR